MIALQKIRREAIRWHLLTIANVARPQSINVAAMQPIVATVYPDTSDLELRPRQRFSKPVRVDVVVDERIRDVIGLLFGSFRQNIDYRLRHHRTTNPFAHERACTRCITHVCPD